MVKWMVPRLWIWVAIVWCASVAATDIQLEVDGARAAPMSPIDLFISISHEANEMVDQNSFLLDGEPVKPRFLGEAQQSSVTVVNGQRAERNTKVARYYLEIEGLPEGIQLLPTLSVVVGNQRIESNPTTIEISAGQQSEQFILEAGVEGPALLYPGQKVKLYYRVLFKDNIDLTLEDLPLLEAEGLELVGDKSGVAYARRGFQIHELSQWARAKEPGVYTFPGGVVEGFAYTADFFGRKQYRKPKLRAESESLILQVRPFPDKGKPSLFDGAIGDFTIHAERIGSGPLLVGDKVDVLVKVQGSGDFDTVKLPDLRRMTGFQSQFRLSDLPPQIQQSEGEKQFQVTLRPLSSNVAQIPPFAFAYFNPETNSYQSVSSESISINVSGGDIPASVSSRHSSRVQESPEDVFVDDDQSTVDIAGPLPIEQAETPSRWFEGFWALALLPLALLALWAQLKLKQRRLNAANRSISPSQELLNRAVEAIERGDDGFGLIQRALLLRLQEKNVIESLASSPDQLDQEGKAGKVRALLEAEWNQRYTGGSGSDQKSLLEAVRTLFEEI